MTNRIQHIAFLMLIALTAAFSFAAEIDDKIDALQDKFEARYPELREFKKKGIIGETFEGFVEFVKGRDADAAAVVKDENADRRELYELIATKEDTTATKVAERNARRNFRKARDGEYLRDKNGTWEQKRMKNDVD